MGVMPQLADMFSYSLVLSFINLSLITATKVCHTVQLEAYCDIQITAYETIYEKSETYDYEESFTSVMTDFQKSHHSTSSGDHTFEGLTFSGTSVTNKMLKSHLRKTYEIVKHSI